jgi:hypothetical protein
MPPRKMKLLVDDKEVSKADVAREMKKIGISASLKQLSKLRNGHKVRITSGEGCLVIHPDRYDSIEKTFRRGKGLNLQLSPEEIMMNKAEMAGEGIFGPGFDKFLKKVGIKKEVYALGDKLKGPLKKTIRAFAEKAPAALGTAGAALATYVGQPQLAPLAMKAGQELGKKARNYSKKHIEGYIDDPTAYQKNPKKFMDLKGVGMSGCGAKRDMRRAAVTKAVMDANDAGLMMGSQYGDGLYASGGGLYASSSRGRGLSIVGGRTMMGCGHPAMESQPLATNFHQQFQVPPQFQKFHRQGAGLYA